MTNSILATVHNGRIEPAGEIEFPEGAMLLVTLLPDDESSFWSGASETSLTAVWDNTQDDVYAQLLDE